MIKVKVSKKHIVNGKRIRPTLCPIALVLKRIFPGKRISVGYDDVYIGSDNFSLPKKASTFIENFDNGKKVHPFEFSMRRVK